MITQCAVCHETKETSQVGYDSGPKENWCVECWNQSVYERRAARKAELAARPKCQACGKRAGTWRVGAGQPALLCGRCKTRALNAGNRRVSGGFAYLGMFGPQMTGAAVLNMLREES